MGGIVFINYRRSDAAGMAGRLFDRLEQDFSPERLFFDVDSIPAGENFFDYLNQQVDACDVLLAVIGPTWQSQLDRQDYEAGKHTKDYARIEIEAALRQGKKVIPVLVGGAEMPREEDLPETMRPLALRNAVRLSHERFKADAQGLIKAVEKALEEASAKRKQAASAAAAEIKRREEAEAAKAEAAARREKEAARREAVAGLSPDQIAKAEELANWEFIKDSESAEDFRDHLARFPNGVAQRMARAKLEAIVWTELGRSPSLPALEGFLAEFPNGKHKVEALKRRDALQRDADRQSPAAAVKARAPRATVRTTRSTAFKLGQRALLPGLGIVGGLAAVFAMSWIMQAVGGTAGGLGITNTSWTTGASVLVIAAAIPGIALLYGGLMPGDPARSVVGQILLIAALAAIVTVAYGYSLSFTDGGALNSYIGGLSKRWLTGIDSSTQIFGSTLSEYSFVALAAAFTCVAAALVAGGFVRDLSLPALLLFTGLWLTFVHIPITHWIWGNGFLGGLGALDFAGALSVFIPAGLSGLMGAYMLGRGSKAEHRAPRPSHAVLLGAALFGLGALAMIAGSHLEATAKAIDSLVHLLIATASGGLSWLLVEWAAKRPLSRYGFMWGAIAGVVAFMPAAGFLWPTGAFWLGLIAGVTCCVLQGPIRRLAGYDDRADALGIWLVAGIVGMVGTGVFAAEGIGGIKGALEGNFGQLINQLLAVITVLVWAGLVSLPMFLAIKTFRASRRG
jgi:Amt family ammonium transporter